MNSDEPSLAKPVSAGWFSPLERSRAQFVLVSTIAAVLVIAALDRGSGIAVPTVLAVLAAIALAPLVRRLEGLRAPPSLAAAVIVAGVLFSTVFAVYALLPSAEAWNDRAPQVMRDIEQRVRQLNVSITEAIAIAPEPEPAVLPQLATVPPIDADPPVDAVPAEDAAPPGEDTLTKLVDGGQSMVADWVISAPGIVAAAVYWAVLTFFLLRDRAMLGRRLMAIGPGLPARRALARAMADVQSDVGRYLLAITLINVALGFSVAAAFYLFGVPNAALWGALAGLLNFMPFIGAAVMALITLGVGLATFDDLMIVFSLLGVVVFLNTVEGQIATPMVIGARIHMSTIDIFVAIAFGAWLWGAAGALVATPTLIVISAFVRRLNAARSTTRPPASRLPR